MSKVRSDKKYPVKVWTPEVTKRIFRKHCYEYHLSMMFVGEQFITKALLEFNDEQLKQIIEKRIGEFNYMEYSGKNYKTISIHLVDNLWQKLAFFAVYYDTSVAKIGSCIFDYCLSDYEIRKVFDVHGTRTNKKKISKGTPMADLQNRLSDY